MTDTYKVNVEYTDTFGGEANYCWVRREVVQVPEGATQAQRTKLFKKALGLTGVRGKVDQNGDDFWEFRPYGSATVAFGVTEY